MAKKAGRRAFAHWASPPPNPYMLAWEDSCLPVPLAFPPPLVEYGWSGPFEYHWQLMTYAFRLPNPAGITPLSGFTSPERAEIARYRQVCEQLASCPMLRHQGALTINAHTGEVGYEPLPAVRSLFEGLAFRFRQLHTLSDDGPGFDSVRDIVMRHAERADDDRCSERLDVLRRWGAARQQLRERTLKNIVARKVLREQQRSTAEANYEGFRPDELISVFEYGDLIARSARRPDHAVVATDRAIADHLEHVFMVSILGLCHFYFGYAELTSALVAGATNTG